jgi:hypothetical protein
VTANVMDGFFSARPFVPFTLITVDGRELAVRHRFQGGLESHLKVVFYYHDGPYFEVIAIEHIVSLRTI